jgi:phosphoenolpyruvate carboxykinase (ATP)
MFGVGHRMPIQVTRKLLSGALSGSLAKTGYRVDPYFGLSVPRSVQGVETTILDPAGTWMSKDDYAATARRLVDMFHENFVKFAPFVDDAVLGAQPNFLRAA